MAIIGGAGNPVGGSFTGAAEALEVIGNHAYAFANAPSSDTAVTLLNFTSGNYYFVGELEFNPEVDFATRAVGAGVAVCQIKMNDTLVGLICSEQSDFFRSSMRLIIPAYTEVTVEVICAQSVSTEIVTVGLTGRIYRG